MIFSSTSVENAGRLAFSQGYKRDTNPYLNRNGWINRVKRKIWDQGFDLSMNDSRTEQGQDMVASDYNKDGTGQWYEEPEDDEWMFIKREEDCKPCLSDIEDRPKKGKKGKYLKDWE